MIHHSLLRRLDMLERGIREEHVKGALLAYLAEVRASIEAHYGTCDAADVTALANAHNGSTLAGEDS